MELEDEMGDYLELQNYPFYDFGYIFSDLISYIQIQSCTFINIYRC